MTSDPQRLRPAAEPTTRADARGRPAPSTLGDAPADDETLLHGTATYGTARRRPRRPGPARRTVRRTPEGC